MQKESLEKVIELWLGYLEKMRNTWFCQHMLNMPEDIMAEATANWKSHNGLIREQIIL